MSAEQSLRSRADLHRLEKECVDLTQELKHTNQRHSSTWRIQEALLDELLCRFEKGSDTIASLKSDLTDSNLKIREECADLERILRGERRTREYQHTTTRSKYASETRVLESERQTLGEELTALRSRLHDAQNRLRQHDAVIKSLEEQRTDIETRVAEESDNYVSLHFVNPSHGLRSTLSIRLVGPSQ